MRSIWFSTTLVRKTFTVLGMCKFCNDHSGLKVVDLSPSLKSSAYCEVGKCQAMSTIFTNEMEKFHDENLWEGQQQSLWNSYWARHHIYMVSSQMSFSHKQHLIARMHVMLWGKEQLTSNYASNLYLEVPIEGFISDEYGPFQDKSGISYQTSWAFEHSDPLNSSSGSHSLSVSDSIGITISAACFWRFCSRSALHHCIYVASATKYRVIVLE